MPNRKTNTPSLSVGAVEKPARGKRRQRSGEPAALTAREVDALASGAKLIPLTQGKWAIGDARDFCFLIRWQWHADKRDRNFYAARNRRIAAGKRRLVYMHRELKGRPGFEVDHRDTDGLNNRRKNLRVATRANNTANTHVRRNSSTGYKGVTTRKRDGRFIAQIKVAGKNNHLGVFTDAQTAHRAYTKAARVHFGKFARSK